MRTGTVLAAALALASCEKAKDASHPAVARPASVVFDFVRKSSTSLDGMKGFVGAIDPRAAMMADEDMAFRAGGRVFGVTGFSGIDRGSPLHVLFVEAKGGRGPVLVAKIADAGKLDSEKGAATIVKRSGWVVIGGKPEVVNEVADYALGSLTGAAPDQPTATLYLHDFMTAHQQDVQDVMSMIGQSPQMQGEMRAFMQAYVDGLMSIAQDTDEVRATLDANDKQATLDVALAPHAGSKLAAFVAAQKAGDLSLLDMLPADSATMTMVGHMALGPYRNAFISAMAQFYKTGGVDVSKPFAAIMDATNGSIAMTARFGLEGMSITQLVGLSDTAAASTALDTIFTAIGNGKTMDLGNVTARYDTRATPIQHDGISLHGLDTTYEPKNPGDPSVAAMQRMVPGMVQHSAVGIADKNLVFVMASDVDGATGRAIDALRGKGARYQPDPATQAMIADSKKHGDAFLALLDFGQMLASFRGGGGSSPPIAIGIGTAGGALHTRIGVPVAAVRAFMPNR